MAEQDLERGAAGSGLEKSTATKESESAESALRQDYLSSGTMPLAEQRKAQEAEEFKNRFRAQNFELDAPKRGWGPFQVLTDMVQQKKIKLTEEQILEESRRIRDRDFKDWGRKYYEQKDQSQLWSEKEIAEKVAETAKKVKGIDVSMWQGTIDWKKVKESGIEFAFIRATKGNDLVDPNFVENRKGAREAGLKTGYYHYYRPDHPLEDQIKAFVSTVGRVEDDALRVVIDTENVKHWEPFSHEQRLKMIDDWCNGVKKELGIKPEIMIYGSPNFFDESLKNSEQLSKHDLWIANYRVAEPRVPKPWSNWTYWQYSETGRVPGIQGNVDLDMYNGTDLNKGTAKVSPKRHK